jgi:hypothetical protein
VKQRTADSLVFGSLVIATTIYAIVLDRNKRRALMGRKIEPNWTWAEVVVGDGLCLLAAGIRARLGNKDRATYERSSILSFVIGGAPIILWQLWRTYTRLTEHIHALEQTIEGSDAHRQRPPEALAPLCWTGAPAGRGDLK